MNSKASQYYHTWSRITFANSWPDRRGAAAGVYGTAWLRRRCQAFSRGAVPLPAQGASRPSHPTKPWQGNPLHRVGAYRFTLVLDQSNSWMFAFLDACASVSGCAQPGEATPVPEAATQEWRGFLGGRGRFPPTR